MAPRDRLGRPLSDLRLSVIDRCNFRCSYCMPESVICGKDSFLPKNHLLGDEEIIHLVQAFTRLGVRKVRLTGGEPLLRTGFVSLVGQLAALPGVQDLSMTTNGVLLTRMARDLRSAGLDRITVSLDSLDESVFAQMSGGRGSAAETLAGIRASEEAGFGPLKINCVVQKGVNDGTVLDLLQYFRGSGHIVRLIEFLDVGTSNAWHRGKVVSGSEWRRRIHQHWPLKPLNPNHPAETAERYAYLDGQGEIGLINSITEPFCGQCSRMRVTADGVLFNCLFASEGTPVRHLLARSAEGNLLEQFLREHWFSRSDQYSRNRLMNPAPQPRQEMYRMGG